MRFSTRQDKKFKTACGEIALENGTEEYRASFPPNITSIELLGYLKDREQLAHPQGNGRSSMFKDQVYYTFDRTVYKDHNDTLLGEEPGSAIRVLDAARKPLEGRMTTAGPFLELTEAEKKLEAKTGVKVVLRTHGGFCEVGWNNGKGYMWYKKCIQRRNPDGTLVETVQGTGVAAVDVDKATGQLISQRLLDGNLLFTQHEPPFGTFCIVRDQIWFYLWGQLGEDIYLARVAQWKTTYRKMYEFWDGYKFTTDITAVAPVFTGYTSGTIFQTKLFGHMYTWVFIGGNKWDNPLVTIGVSRNLAGPYCMSSLVDEERVHPAYRGTENLYAHPWAYCESSGQLLITWCEKSTKSIVALKLQFNMCKYTESICLPLFVQRLTCSPSTPESLLERPLPE